MRYFPIIILFFNIIYHKVKNVDFYFFKFYKILRFIIKSKKYIIIKKILNKYLEFYNSNIKQKKIHKNSQC